MDKKKYKTKLDFYKYLFFLNKGEGIALIINLLIFVVSLSTTISSILDFKGVEFTNISMFFIFLFSMFNFIWDLIGKYKEIQSFTGDNKEIVMNKKSCITKDDNVINFDSICCSLEEKGWNFKNIAIGNFQEDRVMFSEELNEYLWSNDLKIDLNTKKAQNIKQFILKNRDIVTPFFQYKFYNSMKNKQHFFNEEKLCMSSDIIKGKETVRCHKSNYYNSFLTNEICMQTLERREDSVIIYDASNFFPCVYNKKDGVYHLESMTKSKMNNHIGISTLAYTEDHYLVIRKQGSKTQQNREKYVPTGSGSCDWKDIREDSFSKTITYAMQRELWEENGDFNMASSPEDIGTTKILGFFRWLSRGGKPEFVGITRLNCNIDSMKINTEELKDISASIIEDTIYLNNVDNIPEAIDQIKSNGNMSIPLQMCLKALQNYYEKCPDELREFLKL